MCATAFGVLPLTSTAAAPASDALPATAAVNLPSPECQPRTTPISSGITSYSEDVVAGSDGRLIDVTLDSLAMDGPVHANVLLPAGYDPSGDTRYPVLYLLHGAGGSYQDWVNHGVEGVIDQTSAQDGLSPFITVMPDDGAWGFYSDWYGNDVTASGSTSPPAWTTFDIDELIPWVDAHFPTVADRQGRAVAGLSMGGFGAMSYAARFPDMFAAAGSFSGAVDTDLDYPAGPEGLTAAGAFLGGGSVDACIWGDPVTQDVRWRADDPTYLAPNLGDTSLFIASGNGEPGPYDTPGTSAAEDGGIEAAIYQMNEGFVGALDDAGVAYTPYFYGPGTHSWPYWLRDLAHFLPQMVAAFAHGPAAPPAAPFSFRSDAADWSVWGWSFDTDHIVTEFTYLDGVSAGGLRATGSGTLTVLSAPLYRPGASYTVVETASGVGPAQGPVSQTVTADASGRLRFQVGLGPPHAVQQVDFGPTATATWDHAVVTIAPAS